MTGMLMAASMPEEASASEPGMEIYTRHCNACHPLNQPPTGGPPVLGIALHYHEAFIEREAGVTHMMAFIENPDPRASQLEPAAMTRFGLMPPIKLNKRELKMVAEWFWDQYRQGFKPPGGCR